MRRLRGGRAAPFAAWSCAAIVLLAAAAHAEQVRNRLDGLEVKETNEATEIVVRGSAPPTFTVFKLSDPLRLFVDVSNADISGLSKPLSVENGVIGKVTAQQFDDSVVSIGRIVVGLEVDALYSVRAQGNTLLIRVDASQRTEKRPAVATVTGPDPAAEARVAAAEARAAEAEARARAAAETATTNARAADERALQAEARARQAEEEAGRLRAEAHRADQDARGAAEARAAEAEARAQAQDSQARAARAEAAAREAEARAREAEQVAAGARNDAQRAAVSARGQADSARAAAQTAAREAQARADAAEAKAREADKRAREAETRAREAETGAKSAQAKADARAESAQAKARDAEARARAAEAKAQAADARAQAADAERKRLADRLGALEAERTAAEAEVQRLEGARDELAQALTDARAANDAARTRQLEAENSAREAALAAEKARVAQLESAQAAGRLDQQVNALQTQVEAARREARDAEAARLDTELARLRNDSKRLRDELNTRDTQLANARGEADRSRAAADRLEGELAAARKSEAQAQAKAETERKARSDAQAKAETERKARAEAQAKAETERKARTEAQAKVASERKALADEKAKTAAERKANAQAKADAERKADAQAKAEAQAKADAERKARAEAQAEAERLAAEPPAPQSTRVTQVDFDDSGSRTRVRIVFSGRADYALKREGERTRILEFKNATIEPSIERSLDTSEFTGAVKLISSFQAPPPGDRVRVVVTLGTEVDDEVNVKGDTLTWSFARPAPPVLVGSTPPPPSWQAPPPVVAREVRYEQPRAAVFTGPAQAIAVAETKQKPARRKRYTGRKINVDIKDGDIHNILRLLAKEGNVNIVTSDEVEGTVTMHLKLVPWDQALDIILRTKSLDMVREGDIIRVALAETIAKERDAELKKQEVKEKLLPLGVKLITVNHANAAELIPRVSSVLSGRGKAEYDERTNTVILTDVADHLDAAEDIIRRLDTQTPQVLIETRIIEVNEVNQQELGIQWGVDAIFSAATGNPTGLRFPSTIGISGGADDSQTVTEGNSSNPNYVVNLPAAVGSGSGGALGLTFGSVDSTFNLNVRLSALENRGTVKIISSPKITTLDNKEAEISQGVSIPIAQVSAAGVQTVFFDAVLSLKVTPHVTQDGNIYLTLEAENNTPDFQNVGARGDPTILKKEAKTELLLKDGDTTVIGGIYTSNAGFNTSEVPYLGRIPILGALFRNYRESDRRTELLIFVTPRIVNRAAATVRTVQ